MSDEFVPGDAGREAGIKYTLGRPMYFRALAPHQSGAFNQQYASAFGLFGEGSKENTYKNYYDSNIFYIAHHWLQTEQTPSQAV